MVGEKVIVVVGGGAAGYFGAIAAAEQLKTARVVLMEASARSLAKVSISGGGRCNVTHHCFDPAELCKRYPRGQRELRGPFSRFQPRDTIAWFEARGVKLKAEADGRMFPVTDSSSTITDCLEEVASAAGVEVLHRHKVMEVKPAIGAAGRYLISYRGKAAGAKGKDGAPAFEAGMIEADCLLLATGSASRGYELAASCGHSIMPTVPSLFSFEVGDTRLKGLEGVSVADTALSLKVAGATEFKERGPVLITHWGLSGPAIIRLSAWAAKELHAAEYQAELKVNWLPALSVEAMEARLTSCRESQPKRLLRNTALPGLPKRLWSMLAEHSGMDAELPWGEMTNKQRGALARELGSAVFQVKGKGEFKEEFVTCGGVALKEVDFRTMESKLAPGLYFAGEILDIDGLTGGFNFQAAWTTGWLAGTAMAGVK